MNENPMNPEMTENDTAVSVYGANDAMDDFPVLKAFQQYVDAEQAKARKRLMMMGAFFGVLMMVVVSIFVALLINSTNRNQQLNDRLVEFAMKERYSGASSVVVQPPQDSAAILALTTKLEEMQKKISDAQTKAEKAVAEAEEKARQATLQAEAAKPKIPTAAEMEVIRLRALLDAEKERAAAEKEQKRQQELEEYRRKHYPELYGLPAKKTEAAIPSPSMRKSKLTRRQLDAILDSLDEVDDDLDEDEEVIVPSKNRKIKPVNYFDDEEEDEQPKKKAVRKTEAKAPSLSKEKARSINVKDGEKSVLWDIPE